VLLPLATLFVLADLLFPRGRLRLVALVLLVGGVSTAILAKETGTAAGEHANHVASCPTASCSTELDGLPLDQADDHPNPHGEPFEMQAGMERMKLSVHAGV
jgi:hypothetical protein